MNTPFNVSWNKDVKKSQNTSAGWLARAALKAKAQEYCLAPGQTLHFDGDQRGMIVENLYGNIWLTQEADPEDYLLAVGEEFVVARTGRIVLEAMQESLVRVSPAA